MFALLLGFISYAQTPVVYFPLNSNLAFQAPPTPPAGTLLTYHSSNGNTKTTTFESDWLRGTGAGDYLELSINATTLNNLAISFDAKFSSAIGNGTWNVYANTGTGNTFEPAGTITLRSLFGSTSNGNLIESLPPGADGKADLKIRIQVDFGWNLGDNLRINNLKLITGSPKIKVYSDTNANVEIPNNADAAVSYNTVFGEFQTLLEPGESKTYRVRNWNGEIGSTLSVNNIEIIPASGTSANDFVVASTNNVNVLPRVNAFQYCSDPRWWGCNQYSDTEYGEITIKFVPQGEGVRSAIVKVSSNGTPSPYFFTVIGGGKSCDVSNTPYVSNTADNGGQTLPSSDLTAADFIGGTSGNPLPTGVLPILYPASSNLFTSADTSWYTKDVEKERTFGGIDISNLKNVSVEFNVAAFANANSDRGVSVGDYIILSVTDKNGNWFDVMRLNGSDDNRDSRRRKYQFNTSGKIFSKNYFPLTLSTQANTNSDTGTNGNNGGAYARFKFNIPLQYSKDLSNFKFKIRARANANAVWLIDDISIKSNNANFKTWNGSEWTPAGRPGTKEKAVFDGDYDFTGGETANLEVCECEVNEDKTLTIPAGKTLTVQGNVINNGTEANLVVSSDANLIQKDPSAQNIGNVTVNRYVSNLRNNPGPDPLVNAVDYVYWSSPVAGQNLQAFSPGTPAANIMQYREATDYFVTSYDGVFKPAKGYAIRAEGGPSPTPYNKTYQFVGPPNNGNFKIAITRSPDTGPPATPIIHGYNLIGNPYPSNIDFDILFANNSSLIYKTAWFWKNNSYTSNQQGQGYTGNNYMIYNGTGGTTPGVTKIVKVAQGFLIQKKNFGSDSLVLKNLYDKNNVLRVSTGGTFYQKNNETKNRFWLKLISPNTEENTQLIGYVEGATDDFEQDYDAEAFGLSSDLFYSMLNGKRLLIQGKAAQFNVEDRVILGANFFANQDYTIAIEQPEGIFEGSQNVYLKDKLTGTITDLTQGSYTFEANKGETNGRFEIIYKPETVLVTDSKVKEAVVVYRDSDNFVVQSPKTIATVEVYDLSGKLITVIKANNTQATLNAAFFTKGMYLLRIKAIDGEIINKKIIKQ